MADHCLIAGCEKNTHGTRMCPMHRRRLRVHGDPLYLGRTENGLPAKFIEDAMRSQTDECILWPFHINKITGYADVNANGTRRAHRIICQRVYGAAPTPKHESAHSCNIRHCLNPRHLRWATRIENQADRVDHGTSNRGERQWNNKLSESDARKIKMLSDRHSPTVGAQYGVAARTIRDIWNGKTWAWI